MSEAVAKTRKRTIDTNVKPVTTRRKKSQVAERPEVVIKPLEWFNTFVKVVALITAFIVCLLLRNYKLTHVGTSIILIVLGADFIAMIVSSVIYLVSLINENKQLLSSSLDLLQLFLNTLIVVLLFLFAINVRSGWVFLGIYVLLSTTVLVKDRRVIYIMYMLSCIVIVINCMAGK